MREAEHSVHAPHQEIGDKAVERSHDRYVDEYDAAEQRFSAARGGGKDRVKRMLQGLRKQRNEPSVDLLDSHSDSSASEVDDKLQSGRTSPNKKDPAAWLTGIAKSSSNPSRGSHSALTHHLQDLCTSNEQAWDATQLRHLFDSVRRSDANSKDAAKALKGELKHGSDDLRQRAIKLLTLLFFHTGDRFRLQVAHKRFLDVLDDVYTDKKTSTRARGLLLIALSMLAYESQHDADLFTITKAYNKMKPADMPINGMPLDPQSDILRMPSSNDEDDAGFIQYVPLDDQHLHQPNPAHELNISTARPDTSDVQTPNAQLLPDSAAAEYEAYRHDAMRKMHQECNVARSNAHLLSETLIEHGLDSDLLAEFADKTASSNEFLASQIPWITAQAEESRARWISQDPRAASLSPRTEDEVLLDDLLDAHEKVAAAQSMLQQTQDRRREEEEEARILDRSMREMRMDRSALRQDPTTGDVYHVSHHEQRALDSGSRTASPARRPLPDISKHIGPGHAALLPPPMQTTLSAQSAPASMPSDVVSNVSVAHAGKTGGASLSNIDTSLANDTFDDSSSAIFTPVVPSQKALGKRRALSTDVQKDNVDTQQDSALLTRPPPALPR
jgi:hypothetical protein